MLSMLDACMVRQAAFCVKISESKDIAKMGKHRTPAKQANKLGRGGNAPPEENQFKPGQSGNRAGPPKRRTQLWVYINQFMAMTDAQLKRQTRKRLTQSQQIALKLVESAKAGEGCGSERLARYCIDRDEGKPTEHLVVDQDANLSDAECEQIRDLIKVNCNAE